MTAAYAGVQHVQDVIASFQHALRLVVRCLQTHTGCVHHANTMLIQMRSTTDVPVLSAMRQSVAS